jgi:hypothetical protein
MVLTYCYGNKSFQTAGNQKLAAMQRATNLHQSIIIKEWENKKLTMEIEDLQGHLLNLQSMKVETKHLYYLCMSPVNKSNINSTVSLCFMTRINIMKFHSYKMYTDPLG